MRCRKEVGGIGWLAKHRIVCMMTSKRSDPESRGAKALIQDLRFVRRLFVALGFAIKGYIPSSVWRRIYIEQRRGYSFMQRNDCRKKLRRGNDGPCKPWKTKHRFPNVPTVLGNRWRFPHSHRTMTTTLSFSIQNTRTRLRLRRTQLLQAGA